MRNIIWMLAFWLGALPGVAQRLGWEQPLDFSGASLDLFGYPQVLPNGDYLVRGVTSPGNRYPFIMARYQSNGTLIRQQKGRTLVTLEQDLLPLGTAGFLLAASQPESNGASLFFQRLRPNGDTLPGRRYPKSLVQGYPVRAVQDGDSVQVLVAEIVGPSSFVQMTLVTTDTAGGIGRIRRYPNLVPGNGYPCTLVRTPRGGWLLAGELAGVGADAHPCLTELDARRRLLRQRVPVLFPGGGDERVRRIFNNLIRLSNGNGYVLSGWHQTGGQTWGFLAKLDTALNVVWTYRHPPQATANLNPGQVYELPDGSLGWMAGDAGAGPVPETNKLYYIRVSAAGQLLGQRSFTSAACTQLRLYSWQPLPNGGALVVGGYAACGTPGSLVAYTARLDSAAILAERPGRASSGGGGVVFPNPATDQATWQGAVPPGTPAAELVLFDVLGRVVRRVPVAGRGPQVAQALDLRGLAAGTYACRLLVAGQPVGTVQRLTYLP
jgi:hypothetical protein